jgi:hypothetical protein
MLAFYFFRIWMEFRRVLILSLCILVNAGNRLFITFNFDVGLFLDSLVLGERFLFLGELRL